MSAEPSTPDGDDVHRLLDMEVERVDLVDRAANKHRFLLVKRDRAMDDDTLDKAEGNDLLDDDEEDLEDEGGNAEADAGETETPPAEEGSALGAALAALESLTAIVEVLGSLGEGASGERLATLAQALRAAAEGMVKSASGSTAKGDIVPSPTVPAPLGAATTSASPPSPHVPFTPSEATANEVAAAKHALARLTELVERAVSPATPPTASVAVVPALASTSSSPLAPPPTGGASPDVAAQLAKLTTSVEALTETVRAQQQRLGHVEKQFGLPNSLPPAEHVSKPTSSDEGWPLDFNRPLDRDSVDKAVSFHDL